MSKSIANIISNHQLAQQTTKTHHKKPSSQDIQSGSIFDGLLGNSEEEEVMNPSGNKKDDSDILMSLKK